MGTIALAAALGRAASPRILGAMIALLVVAVLLRFPALAAHLVILAALIGPLSIETGSEVSLNAVFVLVPVVAAISLVQALSRAHGPSLRSRLTLPLGLFLLAGLLSLAIGIAIWDPLVPRPAGFLLVQLAQWSILAFSVTALWLGGSLPKDEAGLQRLLRTFLVAGGLVALIRVVPETRPFAQKLTTFASLRAPFWMLLAAFGGGQLLFNGSLKNLTRACLAGLVLLCMYFTFGLQRGSVSYWAGTGAALAALVWLRLRLLRIPLALVIFGLAVAGVLIPNIYDFAGGDREWVLSGGSRVVLAQRVIEVTMRNPITGLGPAAYRPYARMRPLPYEDAFWQNPNVSSHNNYVDIFSHTGLLGLGLFVWFIVEYLAVVRRITRTSLSAFSRGYAAGALAALAGSLVLMALADWILPFVYNIGFPGFQASVLVWLMLGGLLVLERTWLNKPAASSS